MIAIIVSLYEGSYKQEIIQSLLIVKKSVILTSNL